MSSSLDFYVEVKSKSIKLFAFMLICVFFITARLWYLQIYKEVDFVSRGEKNFLSVEVIRPLRGNLLDRNGVVLASNRPVFDLYWEGSGRSSLSQGQQDAYEKVRSIFDGELAVELSAVARAERFSRKVLLKSDISFEKLSLIGEQCGEALNLLIKNRFQRVYPHKTLAAHVLGYLGSGSEVSERGRYGLEKVLQDALEGKPGYRVHVVNSTGKRLEQREFKDAQPGDDLYLSLDFKLQKIAEGLFKEDQSGAFIVMDPETGSLKVVVSYPNFDPNIFLGQLSQEDWIQLSEKRSPFLHRAVNALYPPASIFKLVTFTTGLEEGVLDQNDCFECRGYLNFGGRRLHCLRRHGHGKISCKEAIAYSCNIPCYEIARRVSIDSLAFYSNKFGLGRSTDLMLRDSPGLVPTSAWKVFAKGERWWKGETLSAAIGQSYLLVTPLQIAQMIGSIATGKLVRPRILEEESVVERPLDISRRTLDFLRASMGSAVEFGSASKLRTLSDFEIYAKTGTAQRASLARAQDDPTLLEHGWFGCYFSYKGEKPLVLISLFEHTGTALPALLAARSFLEEYAQMKKLEA